MNALESRFIAASSVKENTLRFSFGHQSLSDEAVPAMVQFIKDHSKSHQKIDKIQIFLNSNKITGKGYGLILTSQIPLPYKIILPSNQITPHPEISLAGNEKPSTILQLLLNENPIGNQGCIHFKQISWSQLKYLQLSNCKIGEKGCQLLGKATWPVLEKLYLNENPIGSKGCKYLSTLKTDELKQLSLENAKLGQKVCRYIFKGQWPKIQEVNLKHNHILYHGCKFLVANNWPRFRTLILGGNQINIKGCQHITKSCWNKFEHLDLRLLDKNSLTKAKMRKNIKTQKQMKLEAKAVNIYHSFPGKSMNTQLKTPKDDNKITIQQLQSAPIYFCCLVDKTDHFYDKSLNYCQILAISIFNLTMTEDSYGSKQNISRLTSYDHDSICFVGQDIYLISNTATPCSSHLPSRIQLFCYRPSTGHLNKCKIHGDIPLPRLGSTLVYSKQTNSLLLFGGIGNDTSLLADLHVINLATMECKMIKYKEHEQSPIARVQHCSAFQYPFMFIFGGFSVVGQMNDLWMFDLSTLSWSKLVSHNEKFSGRAQSSAAILDNVLYIIGGVSARQISPFVFQYVGHEELFSFDFSPLVQCKELKEQQFKKLDLSPLGVSTKSTILFFFEGKIFVYGCEKMKEEREGLFSIDFLKEEVNFYRGFDFDHPCLIKGGLIGNCLVSSEKISATYFFYINLMGIDGKISRKKKIKVEENKISIIESSSYFKSSTFCQSLSNHQNNSSTNDFHCCVLGKQDISNIFQMFKTKIPKISFNIGTQDGVKTAEILSRKSKYFQYLLKNRGEKEEKICKQVPTFDLTIFETQSIIFYCSSNTLLIQKDASLLTLMNLLLFFSYYIFPEACSVLEEHIVTSSVSSDYFDLIELSEQKQIWSLWERAWIRILSEVKGYSQLSGLINDNIQNPHFSQMFNNNKLEIIERNPTILQVLSPQQ